MEVWAGQTTKPINHQQKANVFALLCWLMVGCFGGRPQFHFMKLKSCSSHSAILRKANFIFFCFAGVADGLAAGGWPPLGPRLIDSISFHPSALSLSSSTTNNQINLIKLIDWCCWGSLRSTNKSIIDLLIGCAGSTFIKKRDCWAQKEEKKRKHSFDWRMGMMKSKVNVLNEANAGLFISYLWVIGRRPIYRGWIAFHSFISIQEFQFINLALSWNQP